MPTTESKFPLIGSRYRLQGKLGAGGMGVVYNAEDRLVGQRIALKRISLPDVPDDSSPSDSQNARYALSTEFRALASLRHPNIIAVVDYGFDSDRQPFFTMQLLEKPKPISDAAQSLDRKGKIRLLLEMMQALAYVHRRGIIHQDLKPGNILVTIDGQVKVLDFGLAIVTSTVSQSSQELRETLAGTVSYMAPELFTEERASIESDIYAVGIVATEIFLGHQPFGGKNPAALITSILSKSPDLEGMDVDLVPVIGRMLAKRPQDRYHSMEEAIQALYEASGEAAPVESVAVRESFLQAANFVGRGEELNKLIHSLKNIINQRPDNPSSKLGSAWLIGGESGVGKSRLLDEVRVWGLVNGALVLHGQGVAEGGLPYQLWREPLRRLVLATPINDTDAAILQEIIPDIETLLERPIPPVAAIEGKGGQRRLIGAITSLFGQSEEPILLILEDLQWSGESLDVLKSLIAAIADLRLCLICSYRDEERPGLPEELAGIQLMKLHRLSPENISQLTVSMLGEAGQQAHVIDFLHRETEGNAFFLVEVVRALAEEAGGLRDIGHMTLPQSMLAGGVRQIVRRRLERIPDDVRPFLKRAAVAGRQLDLQVLQTTYANDQLTPEILEDWLTLCANAAVIELFDEKWRFSHDKLREALLADLQESELQTLHRQIAEAIEVVYPEDKALASILAKHWRVAGDVIKEAHYLQISLAEARRITAYLDSIEYGQRLLEILPADDLVKITEARINLANTFSNVRRNDESVALYEECLQVSRDLNNKSLLAKTLRGLSSLRWTQGLLDEAMSRCQEGIAIAEEINDSLLLGKFHLDLGTINLIMDKYDQAIAEYQKAHAYLVGRDESSAAGTLMNWGVVYERQGKISDALSNYERALTAFRALGERYGTSNSLANIGLSNRKLGNFESARDYILQYEAIGRELASPVHEALASANLMMLSRDVGDFKSAEEYATKILQKLALDSEYYYAPNDYHGVAYLYLLKRDLPKAMEYTLKAMELADKAHNGATIYSSRLQQAHIHLLQGELNEALAVVEEVLKLEYDNASIRQTYGIVLARLGRNDEAREKLNLVLAEDNEDLLRTPELWESKFQCAHVLATLALIAPENEQKKFLKQSLAAYHAAYKQVSVKGVIMEQLLMLDLITPLDTQGLLQPIDALLTGM